MFSFVNRTVFDIPITWDRTHFKATHNKYRSARKLIQISINVQYEKQLRNICQQNAEIEKRIAEANENLLEQEKKARIFGTLTEIASQSPSTHFDKRMENVRSIVRKYSNAIEKALLEETQYWKEIHSAIDQNLVNSNDIRAYIERAQVINEAQSTSELLNNYQADVSIYMNHLPSQESLMPVKQERISATSNHIDSPINKTYVVKLDETTAAETNATLRPIETSSYLLPVGVEASPIYSQPNPPARLCFTPTFLQDEQSEPIKSVLSPIDQNQIMQPKLIIQRISEKFLLEHLAKQSMNNVHIQPKLSNSIQGESSLPLENTSASSKSRSRLRTDSSIKSESESMHATNSTKQARKPRKAVSADRDTKSSAMVLRQKRAASIVEIDDEKPKRKATKKRKTKKAKENEIPIRELSPLPSIDRSLHYSTHFSSSTHRLTNLASKMVRTEKENEHRKSKPYSQLKNKITRKKSNQSKKSSKLAKNKKPDCIVIE